MDQLAQEYAGRAVFLEQDVDSPLGQRYGRWWAGYGSGGTVYLPLMMTGSGHQISTGYVDFENTYRAMVEAELARPALASLEVYTWRAGDQVRFSGRLTNLSGVTLSAANAFALHALVYEDTHVIHTGRIVRAAVYSSISTALAPGATMEFSLATTDLTGVDWNKLHTVVLADCRPGGSTGAYDMLQAAVPLPAALTFQPAPVAFMVAPGDPSPALPVSLQGPPGLTWSASESLPWLLVTPASGPLTTAPVLSVSNLSNGWQEGTITFTATDGATLNIVQALTVKAYLGPVDRVFLPLVRR